MVDHPEPLDGSVSFKAENNDNPEGPWGVGKKRERSGRETRHALAYIFKFSSVLT